MSLLMLAAIVFVLVLQVIMLLRGRSQHADEMRFRLLQEAQEKGMARLERELREELSRGRREDAEEAFRDRDERAHSSNLLSQTVTTQVGQFGTLQAERLEGFSRELNRFSLGLDERFERLKLSVENRLTAIQVDNSAKLEEMRRTVDEKLHATLEQRLGQSFQLVSERLEQVHRGLGEMQTLAAGVGDLKRVLTNVNHVAPGVRFSYLLCLNNYSRLNSSPPMWRRVRIVTSEWILLFDCRARVTARWSGYRLMRNFRLRITNAYLMPRIAAIPPLLKRQQKRLKCV